MKIRSAVPENGWLIFCGRKKSGGATLWQSSANALPANALPVCFHALPVALPVFYNKKTKLCL